MSVLIPALNAEAWLRDEYFLIRFNVNADFPNGSAVRELGVDEPRGPLEPTLIARR